MFYFKLLTALCLLFNFGRADDLQDFIGDDQELAVLNLGMDELFNYYSPELLMAQVNPDDYNDYDDLTPDVISLELERLRDRLQGIYDSLLTFARVLVSMKTEDFVQLAQKIEENPELYERLLLEPRTNQNVAQLLGKLSTGEGLGELAGGDDDDEVSQAVADYLNSNEIGWDNVEDNGEATPGGMSVQEVTPLDDDTVSDDTVDDYDLDLIQENPNQDPESLLVYDEYGEPDNNIEYWDPTEEYEMIVEMVGKDRKDVDVLEKMGILTLIKKILNKIRRIIKKIKKKIVMILKIIKLKVLIKKLRVVICLEIMVLIEKIKRLIKLIIQLIKKIIRFLIKELPFEILWKIKVVIKLLLRILSDIIWELEIIILEILVKVAKLLKKLKRIPSEIIYYFKMLLMEKLQMLKSKFKGKSEEERAAYFDKVWYGYDESQEGTLYDEASIDDYSYTDEYEETSTATPEPTGKAAKKLVLKNELKTELKAADAKVTDIWSYDGTPDLEYAVSDHIVIPDEFEEVFGDVFTEEEMDEYLRGEDSCNFDFVWPEQLQKREEPTPDDAVFEAQRNLRGFEDPYRYHSSFDPIVLKSPSHETNVLESAKDEASVFKSAGDDTADKIEYEELVFDYTSPADDSEPVDNTTNTSSPASSSTGGLAHLDKGIAMVASAIVGAYVALLLFN